MAKSIKYGFTGSTQWRYRRLILILRTMAVLFAACYVAMGVHAARSSLDKLVGIPSSFNAINHVADRNINLTMLLSGWAMLVVGLLGIVAPLLDYYFGMFIAAYATQDKTVITALSGGMADAATVFIGGLVTTLLLCFLSRKPHGTTTDDSKSLIDDTKNGEQALEQKAHPLKGDFECYTIKM